MKNVGEQGNWLGKGFNSKPNKMWQASQSWKRLFVVRVLMHIWQCVLLTHWLLRYTLESVISCVCHTLPSCLYKQHTLPVESTSWNPIPDIPCFHYGKETCEFWFP